MFQSLNVRMKCLIPLFIAVCSALALAMVAFLFYIYGSSDEPVIIAKTRPQLTVALVLGFSLIGVLIVWVVWWVHAYYRDVTHLQAGLSKVQEGSCELRLSDSVSQEFSGLVEAYNNAIVRLEEECYGRPQLQDMIEAVAGLIIVTDKQDRIIRANATACELIGASRTDLEGCSIFDYIAVEESSALDAPGGGAAEAVVQSKSDATALPQLVDARLKTATGYVPIRLSRGTLAPRKGAMEYRLYFSHETRESTRIVAELAERAEALKRYRDGLISVLEDSEMARRNLEDANREIQRVSRFKSQFLANMSHELRTPLNNIIGYTDLTLSDKRHSLDPQHVQYLERVMVNSRDLLDLINRVLDVTTFEKGQVEMLRDVFPFKSLVESTFATLGNVMSGKDIVLRHELSDELPALKTDRIKLYGVLKNLLSNAAKFTDHGEVVLRAHLHPEKENWLRIQVRDTGIGIAPEDQKAIFDDFRQLDGTSTRIYGGSGLGLSIALRFVNLLGGEIAVQSEPGKGSAFTVDIPTCLPDVHE